MNRFSNPSVLLVRKASDIISQLRQLRLEWIRAPAQKSTFIQFGRIATSKQRVRAILEHVTRQHAQIPEWSIRYTSTNVQSPLVQYYPDTAVLELQEHVLRVFREEDIVVIAVHELLGHHEQEQRIKSTDTDYFMQERTKAQEGCAMRCEQKYLVGPFTRTRIEWQMFRMLRALEDLGQTAHWSKYPEGHRMPYSYVQAYVRMFPGNAQHYTFPTTDDYCPC